MSRDYPSHRGGYDDYDHSDEELYVYDQCCRNCRYFQNHQCTNSGRDEFDYPADNGSDWCEEWKGRRG